MKKAEYFQELTRSSQGLTIIEVALILAHYEERFRCGQAVGLSEEEVSVSLGEPWKAAGGHAKTALCVADV
jgi:uncharacterized membrane protein